MDALSFPRNVDRAWGPGSGTFIITRFPLRLWKFTNKAIYYLNIPTNLFLAVNYSIKAIKRRLKPLSRAEGYSEQCVLPTACARPRRNIVAIVQLLFLTLQFPGWETQNSAAQ
jgi:hypothetical protein